MNLKNLLAYPKQGREQGTSKLLKGKWDGRKKDGQLKVVGWLAIRSSSGEKKIERERDREMEALQGRREERRWCPR